LTSLVEPLDGEPFVLHPGCYDLHLSETGWRRTRVFSLGRRFGASVTAWVRPQSHVNRGMVRESQCVCALVARSRGNVGVAPGYAYRTTPTDVGLGRALVLRCAWRKGKQDGVFRQLRLLGRRLRGCWPRRSLRLRYVRPAGVQKSTCSEGDACGECSFRDVLTGAGQDCGCHEISCGLAGPWQSPLAVGWLHVEPLHTSVGIFVHFKHPCANYFLLSQWVGRPCLEVRRCDSQKHPVAVFRCRVPLCVRPTRRVCGYVLSTNVNDG
jgi:hypothetical protein